VVNRKDKLSCRLWWYKKKRRKRSKKEWWCWDNKKE